MKVYRIENKEKTGPLLDKTAFMELMYLDPNYTKSKPSLQSDFDKNDQIKIYPGSEWKFGVLDKSDLNFWFSDEYLEIIKEMGFFIQEYETEQDFVIVGKSFKQCMFKTNS